jgi:hypothetical protein
MDFSSFLPSVHHRAQRSAARRIVNNIDLPTEEETLFTLFKSSDLLRGETVIFFEVHGCGAGNSGANCKVRGFYVTGVQTNAQDRPVKVCRSCRSLQKNAHAHNTHTYTHTHVPRTRAHTRTYARPPSSSCSALLCSQTHSLSTCSPFCVNPPQRPRPVVVHSSHAFSPSEL